MEVALHSNDLLMNLWEEKVFSPSYSSAILGPPLVLVLFNGPEITLAHDRWVH